MFGHHILLCIFFVVLSLGEHDLFMLDKSNLLKGDKKVWNLEPSEFGSYVERLLGSNTQILGSIVPTIDVFQNAEKVLIFDFDKQNVDIAKSIQIGDMKYSEVNRGSLNYNIQSSTIQLYCYAVDTTKCPKEYTSMKIEDENTFISTLPSILSKLPSESVLYIYLSNQYVPDKVIFESMFTQLPSNIISLFLFSTSRHYLNSIKQQSLHSLSEIFDYQIFSWTTFILILVLAWVVIAISQLDYGEDIAGLYSKFHPDNSKKEN